LAFATVLAAIGPDALAAGLDPEAVRKAPSDWRPEGDPKAASCTVGRSWSDGVCTAWLENTSKEPVRVKEVVLFKIPLALPLETAVYGEGFQMLTQTGGTLGKPANLGNYTDLKHYKIPQPPGATVVYGLLTLSPPGGDHVVLGFGTCRRFVGKFYLRPDSLEVVLDTEGLEIAPGERWDLEDLVVANGPDRQALLSRLAATIRKAHPPREVAAPPAGWCSWYCFGPRVTAAQVLANLDVIARDVPMLKDIQLDDGYQRAMGDWLEVGGAFGGGVREVLERVRAKGFEPAIWVAPFVAEKDSHLFQEHPDWFIKDDSGQPLASNRVTFGGWRRGPWYALDGTHPGVQKHLEALFRTMRNEWDCTYFKLDANFWGAMHGGHFHDPKATRVEAYRRGMAAVRRGAGDGFLLGCNHPIWPSFGLIDGSRSSSDIKRTWAVFARTARENLSRNWQNGTLWWNDPDCVVLTGDLSPDEYRFHATAVFASGGLILSGDDLTRIPGDRLAMLRKLLPPTGVAARFGDVSLRAGVVPLPGREAYCLFNWGETPETLSVTMLRPGRVRDFWTGEDLGRLEGSLRVADVPPHSARLLVCTPD
jgi:alpha-galactosidase